MGVGSLEQFHQIHSSLSFSSYIHGIWNSKLWGIDAICVEQYCAKLPKAISKVTRPWPWPSWTQVSFRLLVLVLPHHTHVHYSICSSKKLHEMTWAQLVKIPTTTSTVMMTSTLRHNHRHQYQHRHPPVSFELLESSCFGMQYPILSFFLRNGCSRITFPFRWRLLC